MLLDFINLNNGKGAVYLRLYSQIKSAVLEGSIKADEKLPSIRDAARFLGVSRTTVENAYIKLCIEGVAESSPQRGYYIREVKEKEPDFKGQVKSEPDIIYDFSGRKIDTAAADTDFWKKTVREVLRDNSELVSYGDPQGEIGLRQTLADYSYKARGVITTAENIVIGAGIGPLLNILCGLMGRDRCVGAESGGFRTAEQIFSDYGIEFKELKSDINGAEITALNKSGADTLFLMPSSLSKISVTGLSSRRNIFSLWAEENENRIIIEDDYNGELRYTARSITAFQPKCSDKTVYIGSFSKLLLPSVRIAYMVLPDRLAEEFKKRQGVYNQTCGKTEQLALQKYIETGELEKHLRKLRKLYYAKSRYFCKVLKDVFPKSEITLYESSITAEINLKSNLDSKEITAMAERLGIRLLPSKNKGSVRLCFAGIPDKDILPAITKLKELKF